MLAYLLKLQIVCNTGHETDKRFSSIFKTTFGGCRRKSFTNIFKFLNNKIHSTYHYSIYL